MEKRSDLEDIEICTAKVGIKIKGLRSSAAPGPDKIGPALLKELNQEVAPILAIIFKKSIDTGTVPEDWRTANVTQSSKKVLNLIREITAQ
jgi:hypothetical protein